VNGVSARTEVELPEGVADIDVLRVRGARVHNLRGVDVDIPRDRLVVITGPSGSGKSSLAFDTLFAEGQRQFIESLSVYARQFLDQLQRPDVDLIEGLQPTICIDQHAGTQNPRSTVATVTEIYDYLRLLFARVATPHCYQCGQPIRQMSAEQIHNDLLRLPQGTRAMILAPLVRGRKGQHRDVLGDIRQAGFLRARVDGRVYELEQVPQLAARRSHDVEAVIDRVVIRTGAEDRLADSIDLALSHGQGTMIAVTQPAKGEPGSNTWTDTLYSTRYACPACRLSLAEIEPRTFSFNSPYGACPECEGLGRQERFDPTLVAPDWENQHVADWPIWSALGAAARRRIQAEVAEFLHSAGGDLDAPAGKLSSARQRQLLHGDGKSYLGLLTLLQQHWSSCTRKTEQQKITAFRCELNCPECHGARLRPEARSCLLAGSTIDQVTALSIEQVSAFFASLEFDEAQRPIAAPITAEIERRLRFLQEVGVAYLALNRAADSLSGGEAQRVRLATGIGSGLVGACYILDEPSIGLHPRDNRRLIRSLEQLRDQGNTVIVVEHDEAMIRSAQWLIDMGPGAGHRGGEVVAQGAPQRVLAAGDSLTARYLRGEMTIPVPPRRRKAVKSRSLQLTGAAANNLQQVSLQVPLGVLVGVTGVSGSGKSSLIQETLAKALARRLGQARARPGEFRSLRGVSQVDRLVEVDQSPIGRTPRSNPATYTGLFDEIRKVFAGTKQAKQLGYRAGRFSFNVRGGRCEACQGQGVQKIEMNFLPDLYVTCDACHGQRFNRQTLDVRYRGHSIADVLELPIVDAREFFENFSTIHRLLTTLCDVGLDYLPLGQPSTTLSGGEAQRIKLATELARAQAGHTLYILDEPTTGLHLDDIRKLLDVLQKLVDADNTVLIIEHHLDVIKSTDWIIDLGPEGGAAGGRIVAVGTPEQVAACDNSHTGRFLREVL